MRREDKKKLTINRRIIVNHLIDLEGVLDYLISKQIFTPAIRERIVYESRVPSDRIRHMLDYLVTRNALAYQYFLESLILTGNVHIANVLEPDYSTSEQCRRLIEREMIHHHATTTTTSSMTTVPKTSSSSQNNSEEYSALQYPTTCSQTHPPVDFNNITTAFHPALYSPAAAISASLVTGSASAAAGLLDPPSSSSSITHHYNPLQHYPHFSRLPPFHPNHHHHLVMRRLATYTASPICLSSRSNSSTGSATSQSMSPVINRVRSSSVTAAIKTNPSRTTNTAAGEAQICASASATGLVSYSLSSSSSVEQQQSGMSTASSISGNLNSDEMLDAPITPLSSSSSAAVPASSPWSSSQPPPPNTYDINWNDVNQLELDFVVYKTLPNIRKQLSPNECYQMERNPRGYCLIINNERFYDEHGAERPDLRRYGTDMDASRLKNLFEKLHFVVETHVDLREAEMLDAVAAFARRCDAHASELDAIALILLSHGTDGYVYGVDCENRINLDKDILNTFDEILIGKPKLFVFQACRGEHLNQKDHVQFTLGKVTPERQQAVIREAARNNMSSGHVMSPSTSKSSAPALLQTPSPSSQTAVNTQANCGVGGEEENIRRLKQLKLSSLTSSGSLQLMYKKKTSNSPAPVPMNCQTVKTELKRENVCSSSSSSSSSNNKKKSNNSGVRSRSHSRGKYSAYIVSAASAIRSAMIRTSPCSSCKTISTQTSLETKRETNEETTRTSLIDYNIITSSSASTSTTTATTSTGGGSTYMSAGNLHRYMDARPIKTMLPSRSDFFIWYSSVRGFVSHRDLDGSPFIKCLTTVFSRCAYELELIEMVRKVNMLMQQYEKKHFDESNAVASYFMVPVAEFHLTKRLYFNP